MTECKARGIPVIMDEVFTGLYRLGRPTAAGLLGVQPDIACYAKLLTGGTVPLAATLTTEAVFKAFKGDSKLQALLHGHSYSAHAIGCQAGAVALGLLTDPASNPNLNPKSYAAATEQCPHWAGGCCGLKPSGASPWCLGICSACRSSVGSHRQPFAADPGFGGAFCACRASEGSLQELWCQERVLATSKLPIVKRVVAMGSVLAVELKAGQGGYASNVSKGVVLALRDQGIFARPLGNVVYLMASPMTSKGRCDGLLDVLLGTLERHTDLAGRGEADIV